MTSPRMTPSNINVPIRIEPIDEYKIQEIAYDGEEKYITPLSMSENLTRLIHRIDFSQPINELAEELQSFEVGDAENENGPPKVTQSQVGPSTWPFDSMRLKLRTALTEICVLYDVLVISKEKKHMMLDAVNPKPADQRTIVSLLGKKKCMQSGQTILADGVETLKQLRPLDRYFANESDLPDFYDELREMRQDWRLKRQGNNIFGDLSYFRPIGYRFTPNTRFDVTKEGPGNILRTNQALLVRVPPDLEGRAYIQVSVVKDQDTSLFDLSTTMNGRSYEAPRDQKWQEKLAAAQNVLFCKELFSHLANQAVQYQFLIPTTVTGNQIILALFPDVKLYITLIHHTPNTKCSKEETEGMKKLKKEHKSVFEHSLYRLFRDFYSNMFKKFQGREIPEEAGPAAIDRQSLFEISRQESTLDKIVRQAQHLIMRQQTMDVIDNFATTIKDPLIISHWFCLNCPTTSIVRVDIVSQNNEILGRSHMLIYVGTKTLRVITRDCKNLLLGYEADELRYLLICQSCLHQFIASDKLSKLLGWYTLILNYNVNVTKQEISSTAYSLVICSSNCNYMIAIKSGPQFGLTVDVAQFKDPNAIGDLLNSNGNCFTDYNDDMDLCNDTAIESILSSNISCQDKKLNKLQDLVDGFREVDWDQMHGPDFLSKLELLMASLTDIK